LRKKADPSLQSSSLHPDGHGQRSSTGRNSLHEACLWGASAEVVSLLLEYRADVNLEGKQRGTSKTAYAMAVSKGHEHLAQAIAKASCASQVQARLGQEFSPAEQRPVGGTLAPRVVQAGPRVAQRNKQLANVAGPSLSERPAATERRPIRTAAKSPPRRLPVTPPRRGHETRRPIRTAAKSPPRRLPVTPPRRGRETYVIPRPPQTAPPTWRHAPTWRRATSQLSACSAGKGQGKRKTSRGTAGDASRVKVAPAAAKATAGMDAPGASAASAGAGVSPWGSGAAAGPADHKRHRGSGGRARLGDWTCPRCRVNVFRWKRACFRCGAAKPGGGGGSNEPPPPAPPPPPAWVGCDGVPQLPGAGTTPGPTPEVAAAEANDDDWGVWTAHGLVADGD
jgi:hypothetical protein